MSIFSDVQRNIFDINIESYSKNIPSIHVDPMEYTFERKWKNNNIFKTPVHDLVYCPNILENMRSGLDFMAQIYQIIYNEQNESYYILSGNGVYKTKDFISIKRININQDTFPAPSKRESAAYYDGKIYLICRKKVISIDKNDNIKIIANQDESYASYLSYLKIDENGLMYFIDNKNKLFLKQWDSFILKSSFIGTLESFKIYKNYFVVSTSAGVYLSKDSGTTFNLVVNRHHQVNDVFVPYIDQNGLFVFSNAEKKLITLKFNDSYSEKIIDLGYCRDFYSKNNTIYALCNEGLFKSTDWIYWVEEKEIIPNDWQRQIGRGSNAELKSNYSASGMFIDDKFEIYFAYGYSSQFGLRVKFKT